MHTSFSSVHYCDHTQISRTRKVVIARLVGWLVVCWLTASWPHFGTAWYYHFYCKFFLRVSFTPYTLTFGPRNILHNHPNVEIQNRDDSISAREEANQRYIEKSSQIFSMFFLYNYPLRLSLSQRHICRKFEHRVCLLAQIKSVRISTSCVFWSFTPKVGF